MSDPDLAAYLCAGLYIVSDAGDRRASFSIVLVGNQIAYYGRT